MVMTKTVVDEFMLAEYDTIASAHFDLHAGLRQSFRFYLGLAAVPFTVFAVYKDPKLDLFSLPSVLLFLFAVVSVLGLLMFLTMINTRFDIILYTRAVNGVRAYFAKRALEVGQADVFEAGRKLPIDKDKPPYNEGLSRAYSWLFAFISVINAGYSFIVLRNLRLTTAESAISACIYCAFHALLYRFLSKNREKKEIPGVQNAK